MLTNALERDQGMNEDEAVDGAMAMEVLMYSNGMVRSFMGWDMAVAVDRA